MVRVIGVPVLGGYFRYRVPFLWIYGVNNEASYLYSML